MTLTAVATAVSLTGCGAGRDAASVAPYAPSDGILADSGDIRVLNALVVAAEGGSTAVVSTTVVNRGDRADQLTGITSPQGSVALTGDGALGPGGAIPIGSGTEVTATVTGLTVRPGESIALQLQFARTEPVTLRTVVVEAVGDYASLTPAPTGG